MAEENDWWDLKIMFLRSITKRMYYLNVFINPLIIGYNYSKYCEIINKLKSFGFILPQGTDVWTFETRFYFEVKNIKDNLFLIEGLRIIKGNV